VLLASTGGAETQSPLPTTISEVTLRPLTKLSTELQRQVWPLICAVSPEREPTPHVVATVVRTVRNAIAKAYAGKNGANAQPVPSVRRSS
jgi:hypothetical protein